MARMTGRLADGWIPSLPRMPLDQAAERQDMIDEAARKAGRDPADVLRLANLNGEITDGDVGEWLHGPAEHWVEELTKLVTELRFDGFVLWSKGDPVEQTERLAREIAPAVRDRLG
jgi:alkanesulfonate monooxygenase SsuD/methylene tetrahydromethanopterin reductase-like flavin-dependent oxidoreductase (luciferase family)